MHNEANTRLHDADILAATLDARSDSGAIIRVLAFEVMLKCVFYISFNELPKMGHRYFDIWMVLPTSVRAQILGLAMDRIGPHGVYGDEIRQKSLLRDFQFVFERARYYYEQYWAATMDEQTQEGADWIATGGSLDEAKIRYHPHEMTGLLHAFNMYVEGWLSPASVNSPE